MGIQRRDERRLVLKRGRRETRTKRRTERARKWFQREEQYLSTKANLITFSEAVNNVSKDEKEGDKEAKRRPNVKAVKILRESCA